MKKVKVVKISNDSIEFDNGAVLSSDHEQDCCEHHWLSFSNLTLDDFKGLKFDLSNDKFFNRIVGYGIELVPVKGWPVKVPGYGSNNGYYSSNLTLTLQGGGISKGFDITDCQEIDG